MVQSKVKSRKTRKSGTRKRTRKTTVGSYLKRKTRSTSKGVRVVFVFVKGKGAGKRVSVISVPERVRAYLISKALAGLKREKIPRQTTGGVRLRVKYMKGSKTVSARGLTLVKRKQLLLKRLETMAMSDVLRAMPRSTKSAVLTRKSLMTLRKKSGSRKRKTRTV